MKDVLEDILKFDDDEDGDDWDSDDDKDTDDMEEAQYLN